MGSGGAMANSFAEAYHTLLQEDIESLQERSKEHERRLAEIVSEWNKLVSAVKQRDDYIDELYSNAIRLTEAIEQQADQLKNLEATVNKLAEDIIANKPRSMAARVGGVVFWLNASLTVIVLTGAIWLVYELFKSQAHEARAWLVPTALIIVGVIALLIVRGFRDVPRGMSRRVRAEQQS
jgi:DNA repair exonuclease SbcCD ATPase subunit